MVYRDMIWILVRLKSLTQPPSDYGIGGVGGDGFRNAFAHHNEIADHRSIVDSLPYEGIQPCSLATHYIESKAVQKTENAELRFLIRLPCWRFLGIPSRPWSTILVKESEKSGANFSEFVRYCVLALIDWPPRRVWKGEENV